MARPLLNKAESGPCDLWDSDPIQDPTPANLPCQHVEEMVCSFHTTRPYICGNNRNSHSLVCEIHGRRGGNRGNNTYLVIKATVRWSSSIWKMDRGRNFFSASLTQLFMETLGRTDVIHHHITLKDPNPIRQPVYRVPERLLPVMKEELETMQSLGVIEPFNQRMEQSHCASA